MTETTNDGNDERSRPGLAWAIPYVGMFLLALLLWLPFSFRTTGLVEEWGITTLLDTAPAQFFITPLSPSLGSHRMRPFEVFFHAAAHALDPDSFLFYNVFAMLFVFGKMAATYWLMLQFLPRRRLLAFITAVVFVLYPADTGLFTFRSIHIHAAVCAYLLATCLLVRSVRNRSGLGRLSLGAAGVVLIFGLMVYQVALPLAVLTPLAMLAFVSASDRRWRVATIVWYGALAVPVLYAVWALNQSSAGTYEIGLFNARPPLSSSPTREMAAAILLALKRQVTGWGTAWMNLGLYPQLRSAAAWGMLLVAGIGGWLLWVDRRGPAPSPISIRRYLVMLAAAIAVVVIGMAVFLPLPSHRFQDFRTYFLSMLGSALALALVMWWLTRRLPVHRDVAFLALSMPFVGLGLTFSLHQHQYYVNYSLAQQQVLQETVAVAPQLAPGSVVVFIDRTGLIHDPYMFLYGFHLREALQYLYRDPTLDAGYCPPGAGMFGTMCQFDKTSLHFTRVRGGYETDVTVPYERLVILSGDEDNHFTLLSPEDLAASYGATGYDPHARIPGTSRTARAGTLFSCEPALACYREPTGMVSTYDLPPEGPIGRGWRIAESDGLGGTVRWSLKLASTIVVPLASDADLEVEFKVKSWVEDSVVDSLQLFVNDTEIPLSQKPAMPAGRIFRGVLPRNVLARSAAGAKLVFRVSHLAAAPTAPDVMLGIALNWLTIRPR